MRVPTLVHELEAVRAHGGLVAGVDEVGRGPIAGPIVVAAVILPLDSPPAWVFRLRDSKALSPDERANLAARIRTEAVAYALASRPSLEIDRFGIAAAGFAAMRDALSQLRFAPAHVLVDAFRIPDLEIPQTPIVRGDGRSLSIAAASIVAKVARDRLMDDLDPVFPGYGFAQHKGYGTPQHRAAVRDLGPSVIHRRSFLSGPAARRDAAAAIDSPPARRFMSGDDRAGED